jgi:hypothetical protein
MRWRVEITKQNGDDRLLRDVLEARSIRLHEEAGKRFLVGDPFEALPTAGEVHALASRVQSIATEIEDAHSDIPIGFQIGHVLEELDHGERQMHVFLSPRGTAMCFGMGAPSLTVERGLSLSEADRRRIEEEEREEAYQKNRRKATSLLVSALDNERALQVQRLLRKQLTSQTMWHIAELIQADMGSAMKDLVSRNEKARFDRSINHPDVFGEQARHIISQQEPPPKPMSMDEAQAFIRDLAARWLERLHGGGNARVDRSNR